ncbi:Helix-turn-helix domain-containing protein [Actinoplanes philippinensis]|uniref:Helix-turn-helix domain-containing protein n=1 Tax=Actinoplanes philippinensis TaxID=35752 RepID=A0A1I2M7A2_9ACTN|nr:helix-turn-helix transcriptional regulator [Actinoplanes philippinensis]SFF87383.1 Helix-turn-helix domain-containing protein [Actinoplanes philippinensis]
MRTGGEMNPIAASRLLRADLRRARETAGLTQMQVAESLEWSLSKVTRIESGDVGISVNDLRALCMHLEIGAAATEVLLQRAQAARRRGWWHDDRAEIPPAMLTLIGLESDADNLSEYVSAFVPGLMQTPAYASALLHTAGLGAAEHQLGRRLAIRLRRQANFHEQREPPDTSVLIEEAVLYRRVGDQQIMADQMKRVAELARRPYVTLRVLPFEVPVYRAESFTVIRSELTGTVVYSEARLSDVLFEEGPIVAHFESQFAALWEAALDAGRTGQLLHRVAGAYAAGGNPRPWLWD